MSHRSFVFMIALAVLITIPALGQTKKWNPPRTLRGTITKMEWINPHAWLHVDVKGSDGRTVNWAIELGPPNSLIKRGWTKKSVPAGIDVLVIGYQAKDGANRANGRDITLPDGTKLFAGSSGTGAPYEIPVKK